ncbi:hypothetical protein OT109_02255 [Phycisphaeraceae bacterium D3-23]
MSRRSTPSSTCPSPSAGALHCPSDSTLAFERTGTSYSWSAEWDHRARLQLGEAPWPITPILSDKAPYHTDQQYPYNVLRPNSAADANNAPPFVATPHAMPY